MILLLLIAESNLDLANKQRGDTGDSEPAMLNRRLACGGLLRMFATVRKPIK